jgi:hypothetical protein
MSEPGLYIPERDKKWWELIGENDIRLIPVDYGCKYRVEVADSGRNDAAHDRIGDRLRRLLHAAGNKNEQLIRETMSVLYKGGIKEANPNWPASGIHSLELPEVCWGLENKSGVVRWTPYLMPAVMSQGNNFPRVRMAPLAPPAPARTGPQDRITPKYDNEFGLYATPHHEHMRSVEQCAGVLNEMVVQPMYRTGQVIGDGFQMWDSDYDPNNPHIRAYLKGEMSWGEALALISLDATVALATAESAIGSLGLRRAVARGAAAEVSQADLATIRAMDPGVPGAHNRWIGSQPGALRNPAPTVPNVRPVATATNHLPPSLSGVGSYQIEAVPGWGRVGVTADQTGVIRQTGQMTCQVAACEAVLAGRGIPTKPAIFAQYHTRGQARAPSMKTQVDILQQHGVAARFEQPQSLAAALHGVGPNQPRILEVGVLGTQDTHVVVVESVYTIDGVKYAQIIDSAGRGNRLIVTYQQLNNRYLLGPSRGVVQVQ